MTGVLLCPQGRVNPYAEQMAFAWNSWIGTLAATAIALCVTAIVIVVMRFVTKLVARRLPWVRALANRVRRALWSLMAVVAVWIGFAISVPSDTDWWPFASRVFLIAVIGTGAWLISAAISLGFEWMIDRDQSELSGAEERRRTTQLLVVHRLILVVVAVIAVGSSLFTFPEMRAIGTSILASAGIASIIAGLAAQSILGNLIAGIQVAFTNAIRVDDVVVVEGEWGRIGEINLSYVVVYIWDERRLVVPCSYFTTNPIETWTRNSDKIYGTVYLDLDWRVPIEELRAKFYEIVNAAATWDRRAANALITGSEGGRITVRLVMSSKDSDDQWNLRCEVREKMITWLQREHPEALPVTRVSIEPTDVTPGPSTEPGSPA